MKISKNSLRGFVAELFEALEPGVTGAKRGGGGERETPSLPNPPPFVPSSLSSTPFDACYAG